MNNTNNGSTSCSIFKVFLGIVAAFVLIKVLLTIFSIFSTEIAEGALLGVILFALSLYAWPKQTKANAKKYLKDLRDIFGCKPTCGGKGDSSKKG
jgi:hypothetical protein